MHWVGELRCYWKEAASSWDFQKLMRVRLAQSRIGRWTTPSPIVVDVNLKTLGSGVRLRSHTTDISVLKEICLAGTLARLPDAPSVQTVVDLGANTGLSYRWLRSRYRGARFVCVEPESGNVAILRANAASAAGSCRIVEACIGATERRVGLDTTMGEWGFRSAAGGDIPVVTMDHLLEDAGMDHIDILKCDIEGAERELFANCRSWIGRVDAMTVECHLDSLDGADFEVTYFEPNHAWGFELVTLERADSRLARHRRDISDRPSPT
jgi:FkbM family methyltransferase